MSNNLILQDITSPHLVRVCRETHARFKVLHDHQLIIRRGSLRHTTMQAQPVVDWRFFFPAKRRYRIDICDKTRVNKKIDVRELPEDVLKGWLAHEMGHVVDYLARGFLDLARFGLAYLSSRHFRVGAERMADLYAVEYGFGQDVLATKKFILKEAGLPRSYLDRIERFYMSPEELEIILNGDAEEQVTMDKLELPG